MLVKDVILKSVSWIKIPVHIYVVFWG